MKTLLLILSLALYQTVSAQNNEEAYISEEELTLSGEDIKEGWQRDLLIEADFNLDLQVALVYGIRQATAQAIENGELPDQKYKKQRLISAEEQIVDGKNYRFNVDIVGNAGVNANLDLEVYYQSSTDILNLISYTVNSVF